MKERARRAASQDPWKGHVPAVECDFLPNFLGWLEVPKMLLEPLGRWCGACLEMLPAAVVRVGGQGRWGCGGVSTTLREVD